jgi:hypothetical protein
LDCKDEKGVEKSLLVPVKISYEALLNLLHHEYRRPVSFIYESQGLCTVENEASFQACIKHLKSNFEKKGASTASRLDAFIVDLDQIPRKSKTLKVGNNHPRAKGTSPHLGNDPHRSIDGDTKFAWNQQTSTDSSGLRDVTRSASSIQSRRSRTPVPGQRSRISWDFEGRFRQIDALMGQAQGPVAAVSRGLPKDKSVVLSTKPTEVRELHARDLQAVDAAEAQVPQLLHMMCISIELDDRNKQRIS